MSKGFAPILIILFIALIFAGVFLIYKNYTAVTQPVYQATQTPNPTVSESTSSADMANWKIYRDEALGISFEYPDSLVAIAYTSDDNDEPKVSDTVVNLAPPNYHGTLIALDYFSNPKNFSLSQWDIDSNKKPGMSINLYSSTDKPVKMANNITAYYRENDSCGPTYCQIYVWSYKDKIYRLSSFNSNVSNQDANFQKIFSTFKFTQ